MSDRCAHAAGTRNWEGSATTPGIVDVLVVRLQLRFWLTLERMVGRDTEKDGKRAIIYYLY